MARSAHGARPYCKATNWTPIKKSPRWCFLIYYYNFDWYWIQDLKGINACGVEKLPTYRKVTFNSTNKSPRDFPIPLLFVFTVYATGMMLSQYPITKKVQGIFQYTSCTYTVHICTYLWHCIIPQHLAYHHRAWCFFPHSITQMEKVQGVLRSTSVLSIYGPKARSFLLILLLR